MESPLNDCTSDRCDPVSLDPERMVLFDLRMGYQLWSDVVISYMSPSWYKQDTDRPRARSWQERGGVDRQQLPIPQQTREVP